MAATSEVTEDGGLKLLKTLEISEPCCGLVHSFVKDEGLDLVKGRSVFTVSFLHRLLRVS